MTKKAFSFVIVLTLIISSLSVSNTFIYGEEVIKVEVNGETIQFDNPPKVVDGRTLVPVRKIFEALGATISWDGEAQTVFAYHDFTVISIPLNSTKVTVEQGEGNIEYITLDVPAQLVESRTYVPVRFVSETLGATVGWQQETKTVTIDREVISEKITLDNGSYVGEMVNGQRFGKGVYTWSNGDYFDGYWAFDKRISGTYYWSNGDQYSGSFYNGELLVGDYIGADGATDEVDNRDELGLNELDGVVTEDGDIDMGEIDDNKSEDSSNSEENNFRVLAKSGPTYNELIKSPTKYIGEPVYFEGEIIDAYEAADGSSIFLLDMSAFINSFLDMQNQYSTDGYYWEDVDSEYVIVFTEYSIDVLIDDYARFYGYVTEFHTLQDNYGNSYNLPAMHMVEYDRNERVGDILDDLMNDGYQDINDAFR